MNDIPFHIRFEEAMYGAVGTSDCHQVGIMGGCGLDCWVYQDGRCGEPDEVIEGITDQETIDEHYKMYKKEESA